jgi:hypothetical protein
MFKTIPKFDKLKASLSNGAIEKLKRLTAGDAYEA